MTAFKPSKKTSDAYSDVFVAAADAHAGLPAMTVVDLFKNGRSVFGLRSDHENVGAKGAAKFRAKIKADADAAAAANAGNSSVAKVVKRPAKKPRADNDTLSPKMAG